MSLMDVNINSTKDFVSFEGWSSRLRKTKRPIPERSPGVSNDLDMCPTTTFGPLTYLFGQRRRQPLCYDL